MRGTYKSPDTHRLANNSEQNQISDEDFTKRVKHQYHELKNSLDLDVEEKVKSLLIPQTILGRAQGGHGRIFNGEKRPSITLAEIYEILEMNPEEIRQRRQTMQDDFKNCIDDLFDGKIDRLVDRKGHPIYGVKFLTDMRLDVDREFWKGGALVARMDMSEWREKTIEQYQLNLRGEKLKIGYGKEHPVSINRLKTMPGVLSIVELSDKPHTREDIDMYKQYGLIVHPERLGKPGVENLFIRYAQGLGVCDDAAMISVGLLHGPDAMTLGFAVDATDTYTKFGSSSVGMGFDEHLGQYICDRWRKEYGEELLTPEETNQIIYLGAKNTLKVSAFSTSHRRFVEYESRMTPSGDGSEPRQIKQDNPTFINHLNFVKTGKEEDFDLGFDRFPSRKFYSNIRNRFQKMGLYKHLLAKSG